MTLLDLKEGESGFILKVRGRGAFRKRIMEMGFVPGKEVIVGIKAPLKNPVEYTIMGYDVTLRNSEADLIEVVSASGPQAIKHDSGSGVIINGDYRKRKTKKRRSINVALIGNPNCGKTTLFNFASKSKEKVGNYSGVTVGAKTATFKQKGYTFTLADLPGTYSLTYYSPEELFVRNYLFDEIPDVVVNVIDVSNLERNLYLTTQLIDLDIKVVAALNMFDELESKGDTFDYDALGRMIGIPMVPLVSSKGRGVKELFNTIIDVYEDQDDRVRHIHINYGEDIERAIKNIQDELLIEENRKLTNIIAPRFLAIKLLEADREELIRVRSCINYNRIDRIVKEELRIIDKSFNDTAESVITDQKYGFINGALAETFKPSEKDIRILSKAVDRIFTNKFLSYPIFILIMWLMFQATFSLGEYPKILIEKFVSWFGSMMYNIIPDGIIRDMFVDGIVNGVGGVIVFLPNILILFLFISIMEDTGYMARVAFIVDKLMHKIGLHGQSFIPMLMGFGCNVPAIMATRTIGNKNDRLVTMLINPFMSCSARLPVYVLIIGAIFPEYPGLVLFSIYLTGIIFAILIAILLKNTLFKAKGMPFVMELPPYRMPTGISVLRHTWHKGSQYIRKMGGVILIASVIIWLLGYFPRKNDDVEYYNKQITKIEQELEGLERSIDSKDNFSKSPVSLTLDSLRILKIRRSGTQLENSYIGRIGRFIEPVIYPLGFDWKMGIGLLTGIAAKEVVVSTLAVLYQEDPEEILPGDLTKTLKEQKYESGKRAGQLVLTPLSGYSFLLFILIYFPCVAVVAAIKKESGGWKWAIFMVIYTTLLAWTVSFTVFQVGSLLV